MRRLFLFTIAVVVVARPLNAQIAVYDPANTARNSISATIKEYLLETQREQHAKIRRMARRLSVFADLRRFAVPDTPALADAWRRLPLRQRHQRRADFRRPGRCRLPRGEPSGGERQSPPRQADAGRTASHDEPPGDHRTGGRRGDVRHQRHRFPAAERAQAGTAGDRCAGSPGHRPIGRAERHRGAGQDQRRRPASAPDNGRRAASCWPRSSSSCWSIRSVTAMPMPPR